MKHIVKRKLLSLIIMLAMFVGMVPLNGIVSFATESPDDTSEIIDCTLAGGKHTDTDGDGVCNTCAALIVRSELINEDSYRASADSAGDFYLKLTITNPGNYEIYSDSVAGDPRVVIYGEDLFEIESSDDVIAYDFCTIVDLDVGVYYLFIHNYHAPFDFTVYTKKVCEEHTPLTGDATCRGVLCAVCESYYGVFDEDAHDLIGDIT